jgi:chaperonin cofactor prefoldin
MALDLASKIAIIGIAISSIIAIIGLFQNAAAIRKNNRIAISTKLVEGSKLLHDELNSKCRSYQLYLSELKAAEAHPHSDAKTKKIESLQDLIQKSIQRQEEIDGHLDEIQELFTKLDTVEPGILDSAIARSYGQQTLAASSLDLVKEIKHRNERA